MRTLLDISSSELNSEVRAALWGELLIFVRQGAPMFVSGELVPDRYDVLPDSLLAMQSLRQKVELRQPLESDVDWANLELAGLDVTSVILESAGGEEIISATDGGARVSILAYEEAETAAAHLLMLRLGVPDAAIDVVDLDS